MSFSSVNFGCYPNNLKESMVNVLSRSHERRNYEESFSLFFLQVMHIYLSIHLIVNKIFRFGQITPLGSFLLQQNSITKSDRGIAIREPHLSNLTTISEKR